MSDGTTGPHSDDELRQLYLSGVITSEIYCWQEGWSDWRPVLDYLNGLDPAPRTLPATVESLPQSNGNSGARPSSWIGIGAFLFVSFCISYCNVVSHRTSYIPPPSPSSPASTTTTQHPKLVQPLESQAPLGSRARPWNWTQQSILGIQYDTPKIMTPRASLLSEMTDTSRRLIETMDILGVELVPNFYDLSVQRICYKSGVRLDLDRAVSSMLRGVVTESGSSENAFNSTELIVSERPARRVRVGFTAEGNSYTVEAVAVQDGQTIWIAQVIYAAKEREPEADRFLKSIRLAR